MAASSGLLMRRVGGVSHGSLTSRCPCAPSTSYIPCGTTQHHPRHLQLPSHALSQPTIGSARPERLVASPICGMRKERKKLSKVLKQHRKRLEALLPAVTVDSPDAVLSDLLSELRNLQSRLENGADQRHIDALLFNDSSDSDSDSECQSRSLASAASARSCARRLVVAAATATTTPTLPQSSSLNESDTLTIHARGVTVDIPLPQLESEPEVWSADDFAAMQFAGCGRVLVCQGGKCQRKGALEVLQAVSALASNSPGIEVMPCKCVGKCSEGAALRVRPEGAKCAVYTRVQPQQLPSVFEAHFAAPPAPAPEAAACCTGCGTHNHAHEGAHAAADPAAVV